MAKRTDIDFSDHQLTITKQEGLLVHDLAVPGVYTNCVKFINTNGIMAVTGDFGNWIFCREFHPSADGRVCDSYWLEKLRIASSQEPCDFDPKTAQDEIKELLEDPDHSLTLNEIEWLKELSDAATEGEYQYIAAAVDYPGEFPSEMIPKGKIIKYWLLIIFDAFEEICKILKEQSEKG